MGWKRLYRDVFDAYGYDPNRGESKATSLRLAPLLFDLVHQRTIASEAF